MLRHLYNRALQERIETHQAGRKINYYDQQAQIPGFKEERPWYKSIYGQSLYDCLQRLDNAFKAFFRRCKTGEKPGFPKFKKRGDWNSITYAPAYKMAGGGIPVNGLLNVPKIGKIKIVYHRPMSDDSKIKTMIIKNDGGKWFACFSVEMNLDIEPKQGFSAAVGIDMGLKDFVYTSAGARVPAPKHLSKSLKKLARLQRRLSRTKKRTAKWYKLLRAVQRVYFRIRCQRNDFLHKAANSILDKYDLVAIEDLNIKQMTRRPEPVPDGAGGHLQNGAKQKSRLNQGINDAGWFQFRLFLEYKAIAQGKQIIPVPPAYTSQKCSECGAIVKKALSVRTHRCECGYTANRDLNAARNILAAALRGLAVNAA